MNNATPPKSPYESERALRALGIAMLIGLLSVPLYALRDTSTFLSVLSVGSMLCGASALIGATLGFLFGIPRTLQQQDEGTQVVGADVQGGKGAGPVAYRANTNLEQISDWLTKILVGVGLTQINAIRDGVRNLTAYMAAGLGGRTDSQVLALVLLT